nr:ankyrin repeat domain-containing protein 27-like [Lytechinus pictus]
MTAYKANCEQRLQATTTRPFCDHRFDACLPARKAARLPYHPDVLMQTIQRDLKRTRGNNLLSTVIVRWYVNRRDSGYSLTQSTRSSSFGDVTDIVRTANEAKPSTAQCCRLHMAAYKANYEQRLQATTTRPFCDHRFDACLPARKAARLPYRPDILMQTIQRDLEKNTRKQVPLLTVIVGQIIDATSTLFTKCIQIALKDVVLRTMQKNAGHMDNLKIAMETYIMNGIYTKVFKAVSQFYAVEDANLNKITRNLSELQVKDVGVRLEFTTNVPRARREMSTINKFSTPLGKMQCLRRTVLAITQQGFRGKINDGARAMSSDDLLPLLVFLVVKSDIPNWLATLSYMQNFCLSNFAGGEFGFYMASIEAAVEHVKSGAMSNSTPATPISIDRSRYSLPPSSPSKSGSESLWQKIDSSDHENTPAVDILFQWVMEGNKNDVESMLEASSTDYSWLINKMCHPLCSCDSCEQILASKRNDPRAVTASSRDNRGCTPMHAAAAYGHPEIISILMRRGGEVNVTDYHGSTPLHLACQRGHQNVTLLLLAKSALVSIEDNDGNRPLHLCCANGHEECVKALLYSTRPSQRVSINAINTRGDTALHLASRWGYANIVSLLIEHGASVEARNRRQETPLMCSHNINISRTILFSTQDEADQNSMSPYATSPPIASILSTVGDDDILVTPIKVSVTRLTKKLQPAQKEVEKLLRSVADGDILMMKHHLGWLSDDEYDDDDDDDDNIPLDSKLCHPLCQCPKCAMLQKRTTISATGLSVNSHNQEGYTALHVAALHGHDGMIDVLLRRGAGVNQKNGSSQQCTPLHLACQCNHPKIVSKLLHHAAKCNIRDVRGNTPLHYCCLNGHMEPAEALLQVGYSIYVFQVTFSHLLLMTLLLSVFVYAFEEALYNDVIGLL